MKLTLEEQQIFLKVFDTNLTEVKELRDAFEEAGKKAAKLLLPTPHLEILGMRVLVVPHTDSPIILERSWQSIPANRMFKKIGPKDEEDEQEE